MRRVSVFAVALAATGLAACGGDGSGDGGCSPGPTATMTLSSAGVSPKAVCVVPGGQVTFVNGDAVAHTLAPDGGCAELRVGPIAPSSSERVTFADPATCPFHEANDPSNTAFHGTVAVNEAPVPGPGGY